MASLTPVETKPGLNVTSDKDIGDYLKTVLNPSEYHPVGTCPKMPLELGGVVDEELKVHGVRGLSIIDASIMPLTVGATTQSTVYAIAEKVSFLIYLLGVKCIANVWVGCGFDKSESVMDGERREYIERLHNARSAPMMPVIETMPKTSDILRKTYTSSKY